MKTLNFKVATLGVALALAGTLGTSCNSLTKTQKGAAIGVAGGGVLGALVGKAVGDAVGTALGETVGNAVGGTVG